MTIRPKHRVRFDDTLPIFAAIVMEHLGDQALKTHAFLRDATGRLTLILRDKVEESKRKAIAEAASTRLGPYTDGPDLTVLTPSQMFDETLKDEAGDNEEALNHESFNGVVRLIDRRIIGQDWTRPNFAPVPNAPPVVTFYSCKGGVGRSTALAVASAALAYRGLNILVIDLDLEAPGLGTMLLDTASAPRYGSLDYLVENGFCGIDNEFLRSCVATSPLTHGKGLVEVVPATGSVSNDHPQNVLTKLGRAFLDDPDEDGDIKYLRDQIRQLVEDFSSIGRYDAIFVDARAGLSEASAATVIGLGGDVLCFGVDTPQTFDSYSYLFSHLSRFAQSASRENDWRSRMRMIHAKAGRLTKDHMRFRERAQMLFEQFLYEESGSIPGDEFNFDLNDENAPHYAWPILFDADYAEFDPVLDPNRLQLEFFASSFGPFVDRLNALVAPNEK